MAEGWQKKQKRHDTELIYLAWHIAAFSRQDKLSPWETIIKSLEAPEQTEDDMVTVARALNKAFGGVEVIADDDICQD